MIVLQYFETDDPELFKTKIKYILENDVTDLGMDFTEEEFDPFHKVWQLIVSAYSSRSCFSCRLFL